MKSTDGLRFLVAGIGAVSIILGLGYGFGHRKVTRAESTVAAPTVAPPIPVESVEATVAPAAAAPPPRLPSLMRQNPITGPYRPPLPYDETGPFGSRRTTGTYEVALTFDDGPDPQWTPQVLDLLGQYGIKATFCVIGVNVVEFPHLVREIDERGHTLCNHSWAHDTRLGTRSYDRIISDMSRTNEAILAAAPDARISYFRHPGGAWTAAAVAAAAQLGMTSLHWEVDPKDWRKPGARAISNIVNSDTIPGAIVLLHDGGGDRRGTADALRLILPSLAVRFPLVALPPGIDPPRLYGIHLPIHRGQL